MKSINKIVAFPQAKDRRNRDEFAFLPAALEIVETPPSPIGRAIAYVIMALFALALVWASLGRLDIVATARGKIIPVGQIKVIQPFETGVVRAIHVRDGEVVNAGQLLIELDPTMSEADVARIRSDLIAAQLDAARLQALLSSGDALAHFSPPPHAPADLVADERRLLVEQDTEEAEKLAVLDRQREEKAADRDATAATVAKLEASLPILKERLDIRKTLYEHTTGSKASYLELLQPYVEAQHELEVQKQRYDQATAALAAITEEHGQTKESYRQKQLDDLVKAEQKAHGLQEELIKARRRAALQRLTAPVDGTVQQLAVHTVGAVVTPAQRLLTVVPLDAHLEIQAVVRNRDIGFVHAGQQAKTKVDTFDFNKYGLLEGKVLTVSADSVTRDEAPPSQETNEQIEGGQKNQPTHQEPAYVAYVSLNSTQMAVDGKLVNLAPGMAVTVEIKTGSRRIIGYLLSPLLKFKQEALRER